MTYCPELNTDCLGEHCLRWKLTKEDVPLDRWYQPARRCALCANYIPHHCPGANLCLISDRLVFPWHFCTSENYYENKKNEQMDVLKQLLRRYGQ